MEPDDLNELPSKTGHLDNIPSHVKKRLSKIIEDENGDEDGGQTRPENQNDWGDAENDNDDNDSLLNLDDEDSSDDEDEVAS